MSDSVTYSYNNFYYRELNTNISLQQLQLVGNIMSKASFPLSIFHTSILMKSFSTESLSVDIQDLLKLSQSIPRQHLVNPAASVEIQTVLRSWVISHKKAPTKARTQGLHSLAPMRLLSSPPGSSSDTTSSDSGEPCLPPRRQVTKVCFLCLPVTVSVQFKLSKLI